MDIVKRSGETEAYDGSKIVAAIAGAFSDVNREASEETLAALLRAAEESIAATDASTVEAIQDIVERSLMEQGYFDEAKAYILYRHRRAELRTVAPISSPPPWLRAISPRAAASRPTPPASTPASRAFRKISRTSRMPFRRSRSNSKAS